MFMAACDKVIWVSDGHLSTPKISMLSAKRLLQRKQTARLPSISEWNITDWLQTHLSNNLMFRPNVAKQMGRKGGVRCYPLILWARSNHAMASSQGTIKLPVKHEAWQRWIWVWARHKKSKSPDLDWAATSARKQLTRKEIFLLATGAKSRKFLTINTMAPQTLDFSIKIAKYTPQIIFSFESGVDYWGIAISDRR